MNGPTWIDPPPPARHPRRMFLDEVAKLEHAHEIRAALDVGPYNLTYDAAIQLRILAELIELNTRTRQHDA